MSEESLIGVVGPATCNHRWTAPRVDVAHSAVVVHVCLREADHPETGHLCSCGQMVIDE